MEIRSETKKQNSPRLFSNIVSLVIPSKTDQKIKLAQPVSFLHGSKVHPFKVPKSGKKSHINIKRT